MVALIAAAAIVSMAAALIEYASAARPPRPAHLQAPQAPVRSRGRRWTRVGLRAAVFGLAVGAVAVIGYPFFTNLRQDQLQRRLDTQIESPVLREAYVARRVEVGDSLTRIAIPTIDVDVVVVEGTSTTALQAGAGHYAGTPLPCEIGNVGIAGHRTTYGRPFHNLDLLRVGQPITLRTPIGTCTYSVTEEPFVVAPDAVEVLATTPEEATLTLTTCHPKGSARERLIIKATLVRSEIATP